ncbi:heparinase II/III family protein [Phreatobacter sp. AB_2022a]|uniref:heparinase II/III family protein n=1 Tax=Phreatobacter sp. AB_2022a TaxID=3003134 RepID=UPI0022875284|nr:heparinase II/III family protein [Phreatobacter sp. AB_2022a]MCZ0737185.1 heparinase II/III family protein [Phreatobacter sp. AB_2022a]
MVARTLGWIAERIVAGRLAAVGYYRRARGWPVGAGMMRIWRGRSQTPRILLVPQELRTADPVRADEIIAGLHVFAGRTIQAADPFAATPPSEDWQEALAGFGWLRHLRAAGSPEAAAAARGLVEAWLAAQGREHRSGWQPLVTAERLRAWLAASGLLLAGADEMFYRRFARSLWWQLRVLDAQYATLAPGAARLSVLIALVTAGLCLEGEDKLLKWASQRLGEELERQILPDGGHVSRDPGVLVGLVLDLLPLRQLFPARNVTPPAAILTAVDRMMPMIRFFRLGDGTIARFNGMGPTGIDLVTTALVYDESRGSVPRSAPHSGFERLEAGASVLIADVGPPPPARYSAGAHAGTLSFELSTGRQLLVMNCGMPAVNRASWRREARKTAAHSTVTVADRSSARFVDRGPAEGAVMSGPGRVAAERHDLTLAASHDGYRQRLGVTVHRVLSLSAEGERLDGEDTLEGADQPYTLRFHLHPSVQPVPTEQARSVLLLLPTGEAWVFATEAGVAIEESIALAMPEGPRRTAQLVIEGRSGEMPSVRWTLRRLDRPQPPLPRDPEPELPL